MDGVLRTDADLPGFKGGRLEQMFTDSQPVHDVLYTGPMMDLFRSFLGAPVLHYDFTWCAAGQARPGDRDPQRRRLHGARHASSCSPPRHPWATTVSTSVG